VANSSTGCSMNNTMPAFASRRPRWLRPPLVRATLVASLFAIVNGGCSAPGPTPPIYQPVPATLTMHWESIASGTCTGVVGNVGGVTARNVNVFFSYSTAQGDTALGTHVGSVAGGARVVVHAPAQVTRGEARFPDLVGFRWDGSYQGPVSGTPPRTYVAYYSYPCLVGPDSARVWIRNNYYGVAGLAYHVVLNVETPTGVEQIPLRQTAVGPIVNTDCAAGGAQGCEGWGNFHLAVRDSAGIKLLPRIISMHWENSFGVADSLVLPDPYYGYDFEQYGVVGNCPPI
jgi:hypothetical protein